MCNESLWWMLCRCFLFISQCGWRVDIHYVSPRWILDSVLLQLPHEYVYTRACKGLYRLGCVWRFNTTVCVCLSSFFFTHVRLFSVFEQGLSSSNFSSLPPRHPVLFYCPPFHLRLSVSALFFSPLWYFPAVWWLSRIFLFHCQFSQTVAYATVCICNLITDAPHWQQVQLCMDLCLSLISQEILSCVVQNIWMRVCVHVCGCVKEIVFTDLALMWILLCLNPYRLLSWFSSLIGQCLLRMFRKCCGLG